MDLKVVLEKHNKWLKNQKGGERAKLSGANLSRADFSRADLSLADLSWANLSWANLSRANLSGADLFMANLFGADLSMANLYCTCWPLWCGTKNVKVDLAIVSQLAAHFCALDCNDPHYVAARKKLLPLAKLSTHAKDLEI